MTVEALNRLTSNDIILERDSKGKLPLHWAAEAGFTDGLNSLIGFHPQLEAAHMSDKTEKSRATILGLKEYINAPDMSGNTALHYAAENGHEQFVAQLLRGEMFADINIRNHNGHTALVVAKRNHRVWIVAELKGYCRNE